MFGRYKFPLQLSSLLSLSRQHRLKILDPPYLSFELHHSLCTLRRSVSFDTKFFLEQF